MNRIYSVEYRYTPVLSIIISHSRSVMWTVRWDESLGRYVKVGRLMFTDH